MIMIKGLLCFGSEVLCPSGPGVGDLLLSSFPLGSAGIFRGWGLVDGLPVNEGMCLKGKLGPYPCFLF